MGQNVVPGTQRPGGRTAKVRSAVIAATVVELAETGFGELNMDEVAKRAGVGKTTVYRRWGNKSGLAADVLTELADQSVTHPDTGSIEGNLRVQAESVRDALTRSDMSEAFRALIAAANCDTRTSTAMNTFHTRRNKEWAANIAASVQRGELPEGTDPIEVSRAVAAPLYYRCAITRDPITDADVERAVTATLAAARAGAYALRTGRPGADAD